MLFIWCDSKAGNDFFIVAPFVMGTGWSNLFNFGFHTSGDEKRSELIYPLLGPSGNPSSVPGCYGQSDLNLCGLGDLSRHFFFFIGEHISWFMSKIVAQCLCLPVTNGAQQFISSTSKHCCPTKNMFCSELMIWNQAASTNSYLLSWRGPLEVGAKWRKLAFIFSCISISFVIPMIRP